VEANGTPKLLDFGIARHLENLDQPVDQTTVRCTPAFAAPEQIRREPVGTYTDVYALGLVLYELLAGRPPYDLHGLTPGEIEATITAGRDPAPPSASPSRGALEKKPWADLDVLCLHAITKSVTDRYHTVLELIQDVDHFLNHEPLNARPDRLTYKLGKFVRRNRKAVLTTACTLALIVLLIGFYSVRLARARDAALAEAHSREQTQNFMLNLFPGADRNNAPEDRPEELQAALLIIDRGTRAAQSLNESPVLQARLFQTLGTMAQHVGNLDRADSLFQQARKKLDAAVRRDYAAIAENLTSIALLRAAQQDSQTAQNTAREALNVIRTHEPNDRSLLARGSFALGRVLIESGKYQEAIPVLNDAVSTQSAADPQSFALANTMRALADAHLYLGRYAQADSLNQRALAMDRKIYGDAHPQVSDDLHNLSEIQELRGHYSEAERFDREALQIAERWYGKDHPDTASRMASLAGTLIYEGRFQEANQLLVPALATQEKVYGPLHPRVAYVLNLLAMVASRQKDFKTAEAEYRQVAEIYRSAYGDKDYRVAVAIENLGTVYLKSKQYKKAEQTLIDAIQRFTVAHSANDINTGITEVKLGRTLLLEQRYREAEKHTLIGYEVLIKQTSPSTSFVEAARHDLVNIYRALNRPEDAKRFSDDSPKSLAK
jgi:eukaryotic-like serine/threonine-protein kinase